MLIADGGGGYGGTDWMSKDVRFMWSTIANQETDPHFDVVGGWRKTADLTIAHLSQVRMYRDNLASVWPPAKSAAAAAYIARLDKLIADLQATHDAASANYTAFSTVTLTLSMARNKLKPILDEYEINEQLNLDWKAKQAAAANSPTPTPSATPSPSPGPAPVSPTPPVSSARQEQLNNQARAIMYDLSNTVLSGRAALKTPKPYNPSGEYADDKTSDYPNIGGGAGFTVPPVIPPPGASIDSASRSTHTPVPQPTVTPVQPTTVVPVSPGSVGSGSSPILQGVGPTPIITPPTPVPPPIPSPTPVPPSAPPGLMPGLITPPKGLLPNSANVPPGGSIKPVMGAGPTGRMTMPSGGVIGATPGSGTIGQIPGGSPGTRTGGQVRANPVGGVIGQQGGGSAARGGSPTGRTSGQTSPFGNQTGRGTSRRADTTEAGPWDPDNPWATDEGVDPVVLPPAEHGPIDPGPAIGYSR